MLRPCRRTGPVFQGSTNFGHLLLVALRLSWDVASLKLVPISDLAGYYYWRCFFFCLLPLSRNILKELWWWKVILHLVIIPQMWHIGTYWSHLTFTTTLPLPLTLFFVLLYKHPKQFLPQDLCTCFSPCFKYSSPCCISSLHSSLYQICPLLKRLTSQYYVIHV